MVGNLPGNAGDVGSIPGLRTKILHATRPKKEKRKEKLMAYKNKTSVLHLERTESYKKYL